MCSSTSDSDTKCNNPGECAQLCIGNDCKSTWNTGPVIPTTGYWHFGEVNINVPQDNQRVLIKTKPTGVTTINVPLTLKCSDGCGGSGTLIKLEDGTEGPYVRIGGNGQWSSGSVTADVTSMIPTNSYGDLNIGIYTCGTANIHEAAKDDNVKSGTEGYTLGVNPYSNYQTFLYQTS